MKNRALIKLCEELVANGYIGQKQLQDVLKWHKTSSGDLYDYLVEKGYIDEETLARLTAEKKNLPYVSMGETELDPEVVKLIPEKVIKMYTVIPIAKKRKELIVAMANPFDLSIINDIEFASELVESRKEEEFFEELKSAAEEAPIVRLANFLITEGIAKKASDIHIEPYEDELRIRFRIDGVLHQTMNLSRNLHPGLSSRIKVISNMDISERRVPQDGRMKIKMENRTVDMRVNSIPTMFGEKIVIRVLDDSNLMLDLGMLGFEPQELEEFKKATKSPYGMILVTGPTGSGKTTTLYSAMDMVNSEEVNIMTAEDPVEYYLKGINQVQMNEKAGLDFARALRAFLRQDPDVILVGEIRDMETAEIAIKAAQTGHLVLSTLHTNDALSTIDRLINIGIPPFMVASAVILIIAQRLIRKICPACKEPADIPPERLEHFGLSYEEVKGFNFFQGKGCDQCNQTGYKGRIGLYEVLPIKGEFKDLVIKGAPALELREAASALGMKTIKESGVVKLKEGITTIEEVFRVTAKV